MDPTPTVCPWTAVLPAFCPCVLCNALCAPHEDMDWPPWAAHALVVTENGVVGRRNMRPDGFVIRLGELRHFERDVNAIAWDGFDVDRIEVRSYDRGLLPGQPRRRRTPTRSPTRWIRVPCSLLLVGVQAADDARPLPRANLERPHGESDGPARPHGKARAFGADRPRRPGAVPGDPRWLPRGAARYGAPRRPRSSAAKGALCEFTTAAEGT